MLLNNTIRGERYEQLTRPNCPMNCSSAPWSGFGRQDVDTRQSKHERQEGCLKHASCSKHSALVRTMQSLHQKALSRMGVPNDPTAGHSEIAQLCSPTPWNQVSPEGTKLKNFSTPICSWCFNQGAESAPETKGPTHAANVPTRSVGTLLISLTPTR